MRPTPTRRHSVAVALFLVIVAGNTVLTFRRSVVPDEQANMLTEVFKTDDPALYLNDEVFATGGAGAPWQLHLPACRRLLRWAVHAVGRTDPVNALRLIGAGCSLLYLVCMYILLYRQTHSSTVAMLVAVMSTAVFSIRRPYWGTGPIFAVTPAGMALCVTPLLVLLLANSLHRWRAVGVFFLSGVLGNVDLPSSVNLVAVLSVVAVGMGRGRLRAWGIALTGVAGAAAGASGAIVYYVLTARAAGVTWGAMPVSDVRRALQAAGMHVLYPAVMIHALLWLPRAALLAAPPVVLSLAGRYRFRELGFWLWFLAAALVVAFAGQGLSQLAGWLLGVRPPVLEFFQALRLAMLALYVLLAQALVQLIRMTQTRRGWAHAAVAAVVVIYVGGSLNAATLRHMVRDAIIHVARTVPHSPDRERREAQAELAAIADWAAGTTPDQALLVTDQAPVRMRARRSITCSAADVRYLYHLVPDRLGEWADRLESQRTILKPPQGVQADPGKIVSFVDAFWRQRGLVPAQTYVLISAEATPAPTRRLVHVQPPHGLWGRHWCVLRVLHAVAEIPATVPAAPATLPGAITDKIEMHPGPPIR